MEQVRDYAERELIGFDGGLGDDDDVDIEKAKRAIQQESIVKGKLIIRLKLQKM